MLLKVSQWEEDAIQHSAMEVGSSSLMTAGS